MTDHSPTSPQQKDTPTHYSIHPLIEQRWSPRAFSSEIVSEDQLRQLFEAARWAPSSYNAQPWRFVYALRGTAAYDKLYWALLEGNRQWAQLAPALVLVAAKKTFDNHKPNRHALHDTGAAVAMLSVQAQSMGMAIRQMAGVDLTALREAFGVPAGYDIVSVLAIGHYGGALDRLAEGLRDRELATRQRHPQAIFVGVGEWPS